MVQNLLRLWDELLESKQQVWLILEKSHHSAHKFLCWDTNYKRNRRKTIHQKKSATCQAISLDITENHTGSVIMLDEYLHQAVVAFQDGHKVLIDLRVVFVGFFDRADIVDSALVHGCVLWSNSCCCSTQNRRRSRSMKMKTNKREKVQN